MKVRCPRKGCNYYSSSEGAEDAVEDLRRHLKEVHGLDDIPDAEKEALEGKIKAQARSRT